MNAQQATANGPQNVIPVEITKARFKQPNAAKSRFRMLPFTNRAGSQSWRVTGIKRDGTRIRENFSDQRSAQCRQIDLEAEYHARQNGDAGLRATRLTDTQVRIAEVAFARLDSDDEMLSAVEHWRKHGRQNTVAESPRLDDAVKEFQAWLATSTLRDLSKRNLRIRVNLFANSVSNLRVADVTPETIDKFMDGRAVGGGSKDNDRRAVSRFFSWCMDRKRRWTTVNPCAAVKVEQAEKAPPAILTVDECERLMEAAQAVKDGRLAPYVAVCLFGGLRPFEASRLTTAQVNLADSEIRLEGWQTKTGRPRVVTIDGTLAEWLKTYEGQEFFPSNWRRDFDAVQAEAKLATWTPDILRHTAISHYFRNTGSYGRTAEQFGNSEAIIKNHYQGRVTSDETKRFYEILPKKGAGK